MKGGGGRDLHDLGVAGGPARHIPVLRAEALGALAPTTGLYLDATFGGGGYTRAILDHPETRVLALDRDRTAIAAGQALVDASDGRLILCESRFADMEIVARNQDLVAFDGIVFDIGVSSMQIDEAERGFSFMKDGPLDMRMGLAAASAADIVNSATQDTLADIFYYFGEERASRRIARAIVADRAGKPFETTRQLAEMIARIMPGKPGDIHPATRTFQALRIAVNDELGELVAALAAAERLLKPGGRLVVVTFHSLEDRIVKLFFAARSGKGQAAGRRLPGEPAALPPTFACPRGQPLTPSAEEAERNPRARSAKLRFGMRTEAPPRPLESQLLALSRLPQAEPRTGRPR